MTYRVGFGLWPGIYFDEHGVERRCYVVMMGDKVITALDAETGEPIPDPPSAIPEDRLPE